MNVRISAPVLSLNLVLRVAIVRIWGVNCLNTRGIIDVAALAVYMGTVIAPGECGLEDF